MPIGVLIALFLTEYAGPRSRPPGPAADGRDIGTLIAMPIGVLISLFLSEFAGRRSANVVQLSSM